MRPRAAWWLAPVLVVLPAYAVSVGGVESPPLAAGAALVTSCDGDGVAAELVVDELGSATAVSVSAIGAACGLGTLAVTVVDAGAAVLASGGPATVPVGGGQLEVAVTPSFDASLAAGGEVHVVILGP